MRRVAILVDEQDKHLGTCAVAEATMLILHNGRPFLRTGKSVRLSGGGLGVVFEEVDPAIRERLDRL